MESKQGLGRRLAIIIAGLTTGAILGIVVFSFAAAYLISVMLGD